MRARLQTELSCHCHRMSAIFIKKEKEVLRQNQTTEEQKTELELVKASEITPKSVEWLWYPYIPFGKVTLLQGDPGDGKSQLMLALSALASKGKPFPFADDEETHKPMTVIYQTTEDDADDTVVPRFIASDGDRDKLLFIRENEKSLTFDDERIRTAIIIAHMNKMRETSPLYRTSGSIDIAGVARSILAITRTPNKVNPNERVMVQVKSNLAPTGSAILFEVGEKGIAFIDEIEMTAEQAFSSIAPKLGRPSAECEAATAFILDLMKAGKLTATACEGFLKDKGFKKSTIKKAKKNAGVVSVKEGMIWYWTLPTADQDKHNITSHTDPDFKTN